MKPDMAITVNVLARNIGYEDDYRLVDRLQAYTHRRNCSGRAAQLEKQAVGVLSRFVVANDMDAQVKQAFLVRPHLVDNAAGFVRMDVLSPEDMPNEIWLMTYWVDIASYRTWHKSHAYHESHAGIPKGLKLVPGSAALRVFNLIAS